MGETTISWTVTVLPDGTIVPGYTFNPWIGCTKISAGCTNCYAERDNRRRNWVEGGWGPAGHRRRTSPENWKKPLAWNAAAKAAGVRRKVFCASLGDVFEGRFELHEWRQELWSLIIQTPDLDWLLLTKRPENVMNMSIALWPCLEERLPDNVWIGTTAENQEMADKRIPELLKIPARVRFLSVEPMLGMVNLGTWLVDRRNTELGTMSGVDWVICGGESGPNARPMQSDWALWLRDQCQIANVPFFFKQIGGTKRVDGNWGGDLLAGSRYHEFPEVKP